jgi:hypothetical protein
MSTQVLYWIPGDGDEESHPNVFNINKSIDAIKLKDIKEVKKQAFSYSVTDVDTLLKYLSLALFINTHYISIYHRLSLYLGNTILELNLHLRAPMVWFLCI